MYNIGGPFETDTPGHAAMKQPGVTSDSASSYVVALVINIT